MIEVNGSWLYVKQGHDRIVVHLPNVMGIGIYRPTYEEGLDLEVVFKMKDRHEIWLNMPIDEAGQSEAYVLTAMFEAWTKEG